MVCMQRISDIVLLGCLFFDVLHLQVLNHAI